MRRGALVVGVGALLGTQPAWAGCCGGASPLPLWLDRSEVVFVGADVTARLGAARWDAAGLVRRASGTSDTLTPRLAVAWRPSRTLQLSASLPGVVRHARTADDAAWGGGLGDLELGLAADPWTPPGTHLPFLTLRARLPTGRPPADANTPLAADATGEPGTTLRAGVGVQGGDAVLTRIDADAGARVAPGRTGAVLGLGVAVGGTVGTARLSGTLRAEVLWPATTTPEVVTASTRAGLLATLPFRGGRGWVSADADLPVPGVGREAPIGVGLGGGIAFVGVRR